MYKSDHLEVSYKANRRIRFRQEKSTIHCLMSFVLYNGFACMSSKRILTVYGGYILHKTEALMLRAVLI